LENLLKWAMLNTTNVTFNKENIDLVELAKQERKNVNERINQKGLKLELKFDESLIIHADKRMIETAMRNIISNAIKFTPTGGRVSIFGERSDDLVTLYISDTGLGMDEEQQEQLFDVGHKNVTQDTEDHVSTGFGLILTKELIEQNGGTIQVESIPASGTTFELNFASLDPQQEEKLAD
ncbi:MAG: sensor histidine kinase, partial [Cyclobacteriaceae bacterium]